MSSETDETRTRILKAACRLLEREGPQSVRMGDIAKAAGISRQAVYLHFPNRADLLIATTRHIDVENDTEQRLAASRSATSGAERLNAFIDAWAAYIPEIYGVARALRAMKDTDDAARLAWEDRMAALRHGCKAAVDAIRKDGKLSPDHTPAEATDILWTLISIENWERLTRDCGWSQKRYARKLKALAARLLIR